MYVLLHLTEEQRDLIQILSNTFIYEAVLISLSKNANIELSMILKAMKGHIRSGLFLTFLKKNLLLNLTL